MGKIKQQLIDRWDELFAEGFGLPDFEAVDRAVLLEPMIGGRRDFSQGDNCAEDPEQNWDEELWIKI